jgi:unspecific monooxygenase
MASIRHIVGLRTSGDTLGEQHDALGTLLSDFPELTESVVATIIGDGIATGFSAPGSALTWIMLRLANHPEYAEHIRQEAGGFDFENMTSGDINRILSSYAAAFVKEVLRLHPPHWMIIRRTASRVLIRGYQIPPGYTVLCIPYLIHRDRRWWSEPEEFDPERWRGQRLPYSGSAYLPFGHGPRMCPARFIGQIELVLATFLLAAEYTLKLPPLDTVDANCRSLLLPETLEGGWYGATTPAGSPPGARR